MHQTVSVQISHEFENPAAIDFLVTSRAASRLRASDPTLWGPSARAEASERLGWVTAAYEVDEVIDRALQVRDSLQDLKYEQVMLCGMGGSSLSPQVMSHEAPLPLVVVDSIHPDFLAQVCDIDQLLRSVIVVSSKSGGTSETRTQLALCEHLLREAGADPAERIVVITDPDSELEDYARLRGYRTVLGNPHVGGRYSALTVFGIVPSILTGADLTPLLDDIHQVVREVSVDAVTNPAIRVAAALNTMMRTTGLAQFSTTDLPGMPAWIEQLVAESTGKTGHGLLPIPRVTGGLTANAPHVLLTSSPEDSPADLAIHGSLGAQFYFWEVVTALLCALSEVNPFDQPDVERTKRAARSMKPGDEFPSERSDLIPGLSLTYPLERDTHETLDTFIENWLTVASEARYVFIQAFVPEHNSLLHEFAQHTERLTGTPATVGYGPSYLHSTGQLHKGGQSGALFLNVYQTPEQDLGVPGTITSFGWLCAAASLADQQVLRGLGQRVVGVRIADKKVLDPVVQHLQKRVS